MQRIKGCTPFLTLEMYEVRNRSAPHNLFLATGPNTNRRIDQMRFFILDRGILANLHFVQAFCKLSISPMSFTYALPTTIFSIDSRFFTQGVQAGQNTGLNYPYTYAPSPND